MKSVDRFNYENEELEIEREEKISSRRKDKDVKKHKRDNRRQARKQKGWIYQD